MIQLSTIEARVLGTMIEKAQRVPASYPMTLNAVTTGCNQKNSRDPVTELGEDQVFEAIDSLRAKGIVREVFLSGSRVAKFRHVAREVFAVGTEELVILAELWLRGPQSLAELKVNASRMAPIESIEAVQGFLQLLSSRETPFVKELARRPGERTTRFAQLIAPDAVREPQASAGVESAAPSARPAGDDLAARVATLETQLIELKASVDALAQAVHRLS